jgi:hypothetical protein
MGTSLFSKPSLIIMPFVPSVPKPPANVAAAGHNSSASVAWTAVPAYLNGGFPIVTYHVDVEIENQIERSITVPAAQTSVLITGLTNGVTYTFVVVATNQVGDSLPSLPSNTVTPSAPAPPLPPPAPAVANLAVSISGPTTLSPNATAGYEILITNNGSSAVPQAIITDAFTAAVRRLHRQLQVRGHARVQHQFRLRRQHRLRFPRPARVPLQLLCLRRRALLISN